MKILMGLDLGTTAMKIALFDEQGKILAFSTQEYDLLTPQTNYVEEKPEVYWKDVYKRQVVGGASTNGGMGTAFGAVFGAVFITIISNFTNMLHIQYNMILVIKGILIIVFVALDMVKQGRRETK